MWYCPHLPLVWNERLAPRVHAMILAQQHQWGA